MISLVMYTTEQGKEPVREWLRELAPEVRKEIGAGLRSVQVDWPKSNRKPLVGSFGLGLYELRTKVNQMQYRVIFCIEESTMALLHGFIKKTQKTPTHDLELAKMRHRTILQEIKRRRQS